MESKNIQKTAFTLEEIRAAVAKTTGITPEEMSSRNVCQRFVSARKMFFYLSDKFTDLKKDEIGEFTSRGYTCVSNALKQAATIIENDPAFEFHVKTAEKFLLNGNV